MFHRLHTDGTSLRIPLENLYSGPTRTACWILGGGPSLKDLDCDALARSPIPKFGVNLAGTHLLRPDFWTAYDPTARFLKSVYLDPGILKLLQRHRAMDLVPETTFKVCDCPNTVFFDRDGRRGYFNFLFPDEVQAGLPPEVAATGSGIVDWQDSFVMAIELAYRLGFRVLYLAGCEMHIRPSQAELELAQHAGVEYHSRELLKDFHERCRKAGLREALAKSEPTPQYHFGETKSVEATEATDWHYFRVAQNLRLARRSMALAGLELISVTADSRLNDDFPYRPLEEVIPEIHRQVGNPATESTKGLYSLITPRSPANLGPMRDFRPHNWTAPEANPTPVQQAQPAVPKKSAKSPPVVDMLDGLPEIPVPLDEVG